jgi:hypothetical protein
MKIGFTGTGGTGKTTMLDYVKQHPKFKHLDIFPSVMTKVFKEHNIKHEANLLGLNSQKLLMIQLSGFYERHHKEQILKKTHWISDRTLLDHWAYLSVYCTSHRPTSIFNLCQNVLVENMSTYDLIVYFPYYSHHHIGETRNPYPTHHKLIDQCIFNWLTYHHVEFKTLYTKNIVERQQLINQWITEATDI